MDTVKGQKVVTNSTVNLHNRNISDTKEQLLQAVLALWGDSPRDSVSVRSIASRAQAAVSAIDYHFGSVEHLYGAAQDCALAAAESWQAGRLGDLALLGGASLTLSARAAIVAGIIDDWTCLQRPLAIAAREASASSRTGGDGATHRRWNTIWLDFWQQAAALLGMADAADILAMFADGEGTQHLLNWNRTLDLALLGENVTALLTFLEVREMVQAPVRLAYRQATKPSWLGGATDDREANALDQAAATILHERGIAALTFRNVAALAGETLGRTTWHFGTKSALLERAFEQLYLDAVGPQLATGSFTRAQMLDMVIEAVTSGSQPILRAFDEIILHIARSPDHVALRGAIRAYRDPAASWTLDMLLAGEEAVSPALASAYSSICRGLDHYSLANAQRFCTTAQQDRHSPAPAAMAEQVLRRFAHL